MKQQKTSAWSKTPYSGVALRSEYDSVTKWKTPP